ncbi:PQQ-binding-like beta-propeller repeat protein [Stackebrandtia soli]|uniref:outer membrane protein assembly factor BamB family protein n=1 Tax=Stackebrandtia soli TaxID=1892856 RepID=UPI0039EC5355
MTGYRRLVGVIVGGVALVAAGIAFITTGDDEPTPPPVMSPLWNFSEAPDTPSSALGVNDVVIADNTRSHTVHDAASGEELWSTDAPLRDVWIAEEVIVGIDETSEPDDFRAVVADLHTGEPRFTIETTERGRPYDLWVTGGILIVLLTIDVDGKHTEQTLDGVDLATGETLWSTPVAVDERHVIAVSGAIDPDTDDPDPEAQIADSAAVFLDATVDAKGRTTTATVRDGLTGEPVRDVPSPGDTAAAFGQDLMVTAYGTLITSVYGEIGECPNALYAFGIGHDETAVTPLPPPVDDSGVCSAMYLDGDRLAARDPQGHPTVYDLTSGEALWQASIDGTVWGLTGDTVLFDDGTTLRAVDLITKIALWTIEVVPVSVLVADNVAIVSGLSEVTTVSLTTGKTRWVLPDARALTPLPNAVLAQVSTPNRTYLAVVPLEE